MSYARDNKRVPYLGVGATPYRAGRRLQGFGDVSSGFFSTTEDYFDTTPNTEADASAGIDAVASALGLKPTGGKSKLDQAKQFAYDSAKGYALRGLQEVANSKVGKQINQVIVSADTAMDAVVNYKKNITSGQFSSEAAGVILTANMLNTVVGTGLNLARAFNADPAVTEEIGGWLGVGTTCATAVATGCAAGAGYGCIAGAAVCAISVIAKAIGSIMGSNVPTMAVPITEPRAYYVPTPAQQTVAILDATRLASVLHHWYGLNSMREIAGRLNKWPYWRESSYSHPPLDINMQIDPQNADSKTLPGADMWALLQAVSFERNADDALFLLQHSLFYTAGRRAFAELAKPTSETSPPLQPGLGMWDVVRHYLNWHDINVSAIRTAAADGRAMLAVQSTAEVPFAVHLAEGYQTWADMLGGLGSPTGNKVADLQPFIRVSDLLHFFAAVSLRELDNGNKTSALLYLKGQLPTRYHGSLTDGKPFSKTTWTSLQSVGCVNCPGGILDRVLNRDPDALLEFAFLRLSAAMSQLMLTYRWSDTAADAIADVAARKDGNPLNVPMDPRTVIEGTLSPEEKTPLTLLPRQPVIGIVLTSGATAPVGILNSVGSTDPVRNFVRLRDKANAVDRVLGNAIMAGRQAALASQEAASIIQLAKGATASQFTFAVKDTKIAFNIVDIAAQVPGSPVWQDNCTKTGGVLSTDANGTIQCTPTAETRAKMEADCRIQGRNPVWGQTPNGPVMVCQTAEQQAVAAAGGSSGGIGTIAVLAGAALLLTKFMK